MPFAAVEVGKAVRRCVPACVTTYGGRRLPIPRRPARLAGTEALAAKASPVRAGRRQPVGGGVALAPNVGLVHASQRLQVGNHRYLCVLPLFCYPPDQRAGQ